MIFLESAYAPMERPCNSLSIVPVLSVRLRYLDDTNNQVTTKLYKRTLDFKLAIEALNQAFDPINVKSQMAHNLKHSH